MILDSLVDECWHDLPPFRKHLVGRESVRMIVIDALQQWDVHALAACKSHADFDAYTASLTESVKAKRTGSNEYGFVLLIFVLTAVASAVIQWLVTWWLNHITERAAFESLCEGVRR